MFAVIKESLKEKILIDLKRITRETQLTGDKIIPEQKAYFVLGQNQLAYDDSVSKKENPGDSAEKGSCFTD